MALQRNVGRIDHVAILVSYGNFDTCRDRMTGALGIDFDVVIREDLGVAIAANWDAGIEIFAPTSEDSPFHARLLERGEGAVSIIFGVDDLDRARDAARAAGIDSRPEVGLIGDEPWASRFETLRESTLDRLFFGPTLILGEIVPKA